MHWEANVKINLEIPSIVHKFAVSKNMALKQESGSSLTEDRCKSGTVPAAVISSLSGILEVVATPRRVQAIKKGSDDKPLALS